MISAIPRIFIKVAFLKHFALEVWVSICNSKASVLFFALEVWFSIVLKIASCVVMTI